MHAGGIEVGEPRLIGSLLPVDEVERGTEKLFVHGLHAFRREWSGIFDFPASRGFDHAAWSETLAKLRVLWVVRIFGFFLGIEMVEVAKELIKAVRSWQKLVFVAEVVLAELTCGIAKRLENFCDTRVFGTQTDVCTGQANLCQARADR